MIKVDTHFLRRCLFGCNSGLWDESTGRGDFWELQEWCTPVMAGALLHKGTTVLYNVPDDRYPHGDILKGDEPQPKKEGIRLVIGSLLLKTVQKYWKVCKSNAFFHYPTGRTF